MKNLIFLFFITTITACANPIPEDQFTIIFGALSGQKYFTLDGVEFTDKTTIQKIKDQNFGFIINTTSKKPFQYFTVSYLPYAPNTLSGTLKESSPQNYSSGIKSSVDTASESVVIPFWLDEGDPVGAYKIDLFINGDKVKSVGFNVQ